MKLIQKVKLDFIELEPSAKADFIDNVVTETALNVDPFDDPKPKLAILTDDAAVIRKHYKLSLNGNKDEANLLKDAITKADDDMRTFSNYVDTIAEGDESIINKAGLKATKAESTPSQPPAKPANFNGNPGTTRGIIKLELEKLEFANFYTFIIAKDLSGISFNGNVMIINSGTPVMIVTSKKIKAVFKNMESNATYQCMVFGTSSAAGKGENSEKITVTTF